MTRDEARAKALDAAANALVVKYREIWPGSWPAKPAAVELTKAVLAANYATIPAQAQPPANSHDWVASTLGHGETMCRQCGVTNREAAVLGELNYCSMAEGGLKDKADG